MNADLHPLVFRESPIHGTGAFARVAIGAGANVVEYVGERISKAESRRRCEADNRYIFQIDEVWDLDGDVDWNPARFLNHSCEPNCDAESRGGRIWIVTRRAVAAGEELTFNYGYDLVDYRAYPCRCGSQLCVGHMVGEEFMDQVRRARVLEGSPDDPGR
jgi:uncharacterized protein